MAHIGTVLKLLDLPTMEDVQRMAQAAAVRDPEMQLREAMANHGIEPPDYITMDGKLHRFSTNGKHGDKSGWYVAYADEVPAGSFGCWRTIGEGAINWRADVGRVLSFDEERAFAARQAEAKRVREIENARAKAEGAARARQEWESASVECSAHPYIAKKGLKSNPGWRLSPDGCLVSPMIQDGEIVGTQSIWIDGQKKFEYGSTLGGSWWHVGGPVWGVSGRVYVAEGVATAASIHEATGRPVVVSYSAGNLPAAAKALRAMSPEAEIVIVADVEAAKEGDGSIGACKAREADKEDGGIGARKAREAAKAVSGKAIVMPTWPGGPAKMDANDYACMGGDLRALLEDGLFDAAKQPEDEWLVSADDWSQQPMPIKWLVKNWVQENALIMVHGPSGSGKTFVVLDWILGMASKGQVNQWAGNKTKQGTVVYLAGEGHQGLRGRIAGWKNERGVDSLDMWLTRGGCDLNTPEGYVKVRDALRQKEVKPSLVVVDTLHRFLMGDENKAQDAKTMLDACAGLMRDFGCSVLLVHHTGVSEEAQHRARGSSAWRGALDIEISVTPGKDGGPVEIAQRKSKDAELAKSVYANLKSVDVPGWLDEDGEQVTTAVIDVLENYAPKDEDGEGGGKGKPATAAEKALHSHKQTMREAWAKGGHDTRDGAPYLARSTLLAYLTDDCGKNQKTAENAIAPRGNMMRQLQQNGFCRPHEHGWLITDNEQDGDDISINIGALQANAIAKKND